jgi:hypothetical protein|tara:strand:+ start:401 stop:835 length:435 start_codon:yes stop_codon:yes gene_type:complete
MSKYEDKYITNNAKKMYTNMDLAYSDNVYFPESLLNQWLNVSTVMVTSSLLFYHMSRVKSIKVEPYLAKLIAMSLIIISTSYMIYALVPYNKRMNFIIKKCSELDECPDDQVEELKFLKKSYMILGLTTFMIQCMIVYVVVTNI